MQCCLYSCNKCSIKKIVITVHKTILHNYVASACGILRNIPLRGNTGLLMTDRRRNITEHTHKNNSSKATKWQIKAKHKWKFITRRPKTLTASIINLKKIKKKKKMLQTRPIKPIKKATLKINKFEPRIIIKKDPQ